MRNAVSIFLLVLFCFCTNIIAQEKKFHEVEIIGLENIQKEDLKDLLSPFVGKKFDTSAQDILKKKFLEISMFESVTFKITGKNTLRLIIKEKKPIAKTEFQSTWLIDSKGKKFFWFGSNPIPELPIIVGDWKTKTELKSKQAVFADGVVLIHNIETHLEKTPKKLSWDSTLGWSIILEEDSPDFYIGKGAYDAKLNRLSVQWGEIMSQKDKILRVDCNFRDRIIVKLRPDSDS